MLKIKKRRSRVSGPFLARLGPGLESGLGLTLGLRVRARVGVREKYLVSGLGVGLALGVGLDLRPYLDPARKCFLARNKEQPHPKKILPDTFLVVLACLPSPR